MATVAKALEQVSLADLLGLQKAALAMGTTQFELLAGGTLANWVLILNSLTAIKQSTATASDTTVDAAPQRAHSALRRHAPMGTLLRFHNAVTDADPTEFDALTGDTRANVLLWLNDAIGIVRWNSDAPSASVGWEF